MLIRVHQLTSLLPALSLGTSSGCWGAGLGAQLWWEIRWGGHKVAVQEVRG